MSILKNKNLCILDIETTGFEPENSEIIEIFILKVSNSEIIDEFYSLFKPKDQINNSEIHGITDLKVKNAPLFKDKNDEIVDFIGDSVIIGHNLENFDLQFLNHYLNTELKNEFIDTLHLSRSVLGLSLIHI